VNRTLKRRIDRLFEAYAEWWRRPPIPPASAEAIGRVSDWFRLSHGQELPDQLRQFWQVTNGIAMDGYRLLAASAWESISGVIDFNELYIEEFPEFFFLGTCDDIDMYAYHPESGKYRILFMFAFENVEAEFDTFDELANEVLRRAMERVGLL
jgi:hypothetical protein